MFPIVITIFFCISLLFIYWLTTFFIKKKGWRIFAVISSTLLLSPILLFASFATYLMFATWYYEQKFDINSWKQHKSSRWTMSHNIIKENILIGKSKKEISSVLGIEDNMFNYDKWEYNIGYPPDFINIDPDYLIIEFSADTVIKVSQHHP